MAEVKKLVWKSTKNYREDGMLKRITVKVSLDDDCKNMHCDFSITCTIYEQTKNGVWVDGGGGAAHETISKRFPELRKFIPLHLCTHEGTPMYPEENGRYFIKHDGKEVAMRNLRCTEEEYEILANAVEEKLYFKYLLFSLGIVARWKKEADEFIAFLEEKTGDKWVNPYTPEQERFRLVLTDEEKADVEKKITERYYSLQAMQERRNAEFAAEKAKQIEEINAEYNAATENARIKRDVLIYILECGLSLKNVIYYDHSKTVCFNWKDYDDKISQEEFVDFVNNVDYSKVSDKIKFEIKHQKQS